jgi:hypothetical protein
VKKSAAKPFQHYKIIRININDVINKGKLYVGLPIVYVYVGLPIVYALRRPAYSVCLRIF